MQKDTILLKREGAYYCRMLKKREEKLQPVHEKHVNGVEGKHKILEELAKD
jgi:hypothetical protein